VLVAEEGQPVIVVEAGGDGGAAPGSAPPSAQPLSSRKTHDGTVLPVTTPCLACWAPVTPFWHVPKPNLLPLACHGVLDAPRINRALNVRMLAM